MGRGSVAGRTPASVLLTLSTVALMCGCGSAAGSTSPPDGLGGGSDGDGTDAAPTWTGDGAPESTVSFADGSALAAATEVTFINGLGEVWDWELVGDPASTTTGASTAVVLEMANSGNGCRVLDERGPYEGVDTDDGAASTALVEARLTGAETVAGPAQDVVGLDGGLGEGGPTYDVARALGRDTDGEWLLVTARAFVALGAQQVVTVTCPSGEGVDLTFGQLAMVSYADLRGLDEYP